MTAIACLRSSPVAILLLGLFALTSVVHAAAFSSPADIFSGADADAMPPPFPSHWGPPPMIQTKDLVQLPGEYGRGSGTLRKWITKKMSEDAAADESESKWPAKDLVGMSGDSAKAAVLAGDPNLLAENVEVLPHDAMVTEDYREDRVRIFVDGGKVVKQPTIG